MKPKIGLITLGVADLARSLAFYCDGLGFAEAEHFAMADPALSTVMVPPCSSTK